MRDLQDLYFAEVRKAHEAYGDALNQALVACEKAVTVAADKLEAAMAERLAHWNGEPVVPKKIALTPIQEAAVRKVVGMGGASIEALSSTPSNAAE